MFSIAGFGLIFFAFTGKVGLSSTLASKGLGSIFGVSFFFLSFLFKIGVL